MPLYFKLLITVVVLSVIIPIFEILQTRRVFQNARCLNYHCFMTDAVLIVLFFGALIWILFSLGNAPLRDMAMTFVCFVLLFFEFGVFRGIFAERREQLRKTPPSN